MTALAFDLLAEALYWKMKACRDDETYGPSGSARDVKMLDEMIDELGKPDSLRLNYQVKREIITDAWTLATRRRK